MHKDITMQFAQYLGYQIPDYLVIESGESSEKALGFLKQHRVIVVKPVDGHRSVGVRAGIQSKEELEQAIYYARSAGFSDRVMLQKQLTGKLYRLLVLNGKLSRSVTLCANRSR